jgi:CubicO group peptidase (beta-lactamase class C family)
MQLVEQKRFRLASEAGELVGFPIRNRLHPNSPITVEHLLRHESSIQDSRAYGASYSCGDPTVSLREWIESYLKADGEHYHEERNFTTEAPGEQFVYSNVGYGLLGLIVEAASGLPLTEYCEKNVFGPLDMANTGWMIEDIDVDTHAIPYVPLEGHDGRGLGVAALPEEGCRELCLYSFPNYPDGLVRTSPEQLSHYLGAYANGGEYAGYRLLEASTIRAMLSGRGASSEKPRHGLCWSARGTGSGLLWGHGGGDPGIATHMEFDPVAKAGAIVFVNGLGRESIYPRLHQLSESLIARAREMG